MLDKFPSNPSFLKFFFYHEMVFVKCFFLNSIEMSMCFYFR